MKRLLRIFFVCFMAAALALPTGISAHSGRTDKNGGHKDNKNVSGLGPYHYHCGGHPAHLHPDGVCPYKAAGTKPSSKTTFKLSTTSRYLTAGASFMLKVSGTSDKPVFTSSDSSVAAVTSAGKVTGKKKGTAVITVKADSKKKTCKVKVETPALNKQSLELMTGASKTLKLTGTKQRVTWKSSNHDVAEVDNGEVYANGAGTAVITASSGGRKYKCRVTVKDKELLSLKLKETKLTIEVDEMYMLEAYTDPDDMIWDLALKWSSSDTSVVTVEDGEICGIKPGTAVITVSYGDKKAVCTVTVEAVEDDSIAGGSQDSDDDDDDSWDWEDDDDDDEEDFEDED